MESRKEEYFNHCEIYKLTLEHYISYNGNHISIEEPLAVQMIIDTTYAPRPVCINEMIERMKYEMLKRVEGSDK